LQYRLSVPKLNFFSGTFSKDVVEGSSANNIYTLFFDSKGNAKRAVPPQSNIRLTIPELLQFAGKNLDTQYPGPGANQKPGAHLLGGPIARISGLELTLEIECTNDWSHDHLIPKSWHGQVCDIQVKDLLQGWASRRSFDQMNASGAASYRQEHGIRIKSRPGGIFIFPSLSILLVQLTSAMVILGIPKTLVALVTVHLLGMLSRVYKQVLYEHFDLRRQVGGMITRLMVNSAVFVELSDIRDRRSGGVGISRRRMGERMREVLKLRESLDHAEIEQLVDYCFRSIVHEEEKNDTLLTELTGRVKHQRASQIDNNEVINIDEFSISCSSNEKVKFTTVATLFDADRHRTHLEKWFTPYMFKRYMRYSTKLDRSSRVDDHDDGNQLRSSVVSVTQQSSLSRLSVGEDTGEVLGNPSLPIEEKDSADLNARTSVRSTLGDPMTMEEEKLAQVKMRDMVRTLINRDHMRTQEVQTLSAELSASAHRFQEFQQQMEERVSALEHESRKDLDVLRQDIQKCDKHIQDLAVSIQSVEDKATTSLNSSLVTSSKCESFSTETSALKEEMHAVHEIMSRVVATVASRENTGCSAESKAAFSPRACKQPQAGLHVAASADGKHDDESADKDAGPASCMSVPDPNMSIKSRRPGEERMRYNTLTEHMTRAFSRAFPAATASSLQSPSMLHTAGSGSAQAHAMAKRDQVPHCMTCVFRG